MRDAPHVTAEATPYPLVQTADGDLLTLWDTPGFGDSVRLARRLRQDRNPIGWFLSQVWDRYQDRVLWLSQLAVRNVAEQADVVLYLVNAAEAPADAGYLASELEVLEWIGKPVLVLLNQTGPPRERAVEEADAARWRAALADAGARARGARASTRSPAAGCRSSRCSRRSNRWFRMPRGRPSRDCRPAGATCRMDEFDAAMSALAGPIARAAVDRVDPAERTAREAGRRLARPAERRRARRPERMPRSRWPPDCRPTCGRAWSGSSRSTGSRGAPPTRCSSGWRATCTSTRRSTRTRTAAVGGVVSGALTGLGADLIAGGLTFGAGMVAGAIIGALGGAGVAQGVNVVRGRTESSLRWEEAFLDGLVTSALLRYLAVAHYGRGRGAWRAGRVPAALATDGRRRGRRRAGSARGDLVAARGETGAIALQRELEEVLGDVALGLLDELYPGALDAGGRPDR